MADHSSSYALIGAGTAWGAAAPGPDIAPDILLAGGLEDYLRAHHIVARWHGLLAPFPPRPDHDPGMDEAYGMVKYFSRNLCHEIMELMAMHPHVTPVTIGGDHSVAIGTWSGVTTALKAHGQFGLLWIDAHMDAHTPITARQGKWGGHFHGTPLAHLLGHGEKSLCEVGNKRTKLKPGYTALVGVRSYESGEAELLKELGVRVFMMDEIKQRGLHAVLQDALAIVTKAPRGWGLSFDLDALDPSDMRAVGTTEPNGIKLNDFIQSWKKQSFASKPRALEMVEYIPAKDDDGHGIAAIQKLLQTLLS
ncbi:MAG TPA: arginase family protein [Alphaproteobacteria bacterium]